jgi:hypothetical protein
VAGLATVFFSKTEQMHLMQLQDTVPELISSHPTSKNISAHNPTA